MNGFALFSGDTWPFLGDYHNIVGLVNDWEIPMVALWTLLRFHPIF